MSKLTTTRTMRGAGLSPTAGELQEFCDGLPPGTKVEFHTHMDQREDPGGHWELKCEMDPRALQYSQVTRPPLNTTY